MGVGFAGVGLRGWCECCCMHHDCDGRTAAHNYCREGKGGSIDSNGCHKVTTRINGLYGDRPFTEWILIEKETGREAEREG